MTVLFSDTETFSEVPIKNGTHAYAEKAEVMLWPYAFDDEPVKVWDVTKNKRMPEDLAEGLQDESVLIVFHNGGMFDRIVIDHAMSIDIPVSRLHDTMVRALCHSLPGSLDTLCAIFNIPEEQRKSKDGKRLIDLFCKPRPKTSKLRRATRVTHPEDWAKFIVYAGKDIEAMRVLYKKLPMWNYQGKELELWHLDQKINFRGVCVDIELARSAVRAVTEAQKKLSLRTVDLTGGYVESTNQRDATLRHILSEYGVDLPDMQMATIERRIQDPDLPESLKELLGIRLQASSTSTAKYNRLINSVSSDGRLRGTLQFCGAARTGRWGGRLFQPQNLPRPSLPQSEIEIGIRAMKEGCEDILFDNVMQLASSAIRGCIVASPGKKLVVSDLSSIEGRVLPWLAGETWKLNAYRAYDTDEGPDMYALAYAKAFRVTPESVMEDKDAGGNQRQIGKVMELMLGYQGGVGAFLTGAATYGINLDEMAEGALETIPAVIQDQAAGMWDWAQKKGRTYDLKREVYMVCDSFKQMWRNLHPKVADFWHILENTVILAVNGKQDGVEWECGRVKVTKKGNWLRIMLPSGRSLCYPAPRIEDDDKISYMGVSQYSRKWERLRTYGGKLVENITQAVARDVMAVNMPRIEANGYEILLSVHDELISEAKDDAHFSHGHLSSLLANQPVWAWDLPLAAGGFESYRYKKE